MLVSMQVVSSLVVFGLLSACIATQDGGSLPPRLRALQQELKQPAHGSAPLSDDDLQLLEAAKIDASDLTPEDAVRFVEVLRFGKTLGAKEWAPATDYATSKDGLDLAIPMLVLNVQHDDLNSAARLAVAAMGEVPQENRSYAIWKFWETMYGHRDDAPKLKHDFTLALLRCAESGDAIVKGVVADLFRRTELTAAEIAKLRDQIETAWRQKTGAAQRGAQSPTVRKVWIEDRNGLRQVDADKLRGKDHWEIRIGKPGAAGSAAQPWGTLIGLYPNNVAAKLETLRELTLGLHEDPADLDPGVGPIASISSPGADDRATNRIENLDQHMTAALAAGAFALHLTEQDLAAASGQTETGLDLVRRSLTLVRRAATQLRESARPGKGARAPEQAGDEELLKQLDKLTRDAAGWIGKVLADAPKPATGGSWPDMVFPRPMSNGKVAQDRTRVLPAKDGVMICVFDTSQGADDVPGTYQDLSLVTLRREDLANATFDVSGPTTGKSGPATLSIHTQHAVTKRWFTVLPPNCTDFQIVLSGGSAVRGGEQQPVLVDCDTEQSASELAQSLRLFAAGK